MKQLLFLLLFITPFSTVPHNIRFFTDDHCLSNTSIAYIFAHGLGGNFKQASYYLSEKVRYPEWPTTKDYWIINKPVISFDFPELVYDEQRNTHAFYQEKANVAQQGDIDALRAAYEKAEQELPNHRFVGVGVSRGASTWINFCALHKPAKIAALVLESPFDSLVSVVKHYVKFLPGANYFVSLFGKKILKYKFPSWDGDFCCPLDLVDQIPTNIPIFMFHSEKHMLIPAECSRRLCQKLANSGHEVYLLIVKQGSHANVFFDQEAHICNYAVHAFYKKYKLPCNETYAQQGILILDWCKVKPSIK